LFDRDGEDEDEDKLPMDFDDEDFPNIPKSGHREVLEKQKEADIDDLNALVHFDHPGFIGKTDIIIPGDQAKPEMEMKDVAAELEKIENDEEIAKKIQREEGKENNSTLTIIR
jgi:hypothetical protein